MVTILIDGVEYSVKKESFEKLTYAAVTQSDEFYCNNSKAENDSLAAQWLDVETIAQGLNDIVSDSIERGL